MLKKEKIIKTLKIIIPIIFGVFLIWITYDRSTPIERRQVLEAISNANYFWVGLSIVLGLLSHLSRAYRWGFTLEAIGFKTKFLNRFMAVMIAYFANLGIPRSGEILRATTLTTYEGVPFEKAFGTIVGERIADVLMSLIFVLTALVLQYELITDICFKILLAFQNKILSNSLFLGAFLVLFIGLFLLGLKVFKNPENKLILKLKSIVLGLKDGVMSIITMDKKWAFIAHTIFIWVMYLLMFYVVFFAIPETNDISFGAAIVSFVTGSFTIATTNGGLGSFPIVIQETLALFKVNQQSGLAVGWIIWISQTLLTVSLGSLSFFYISIFNNKK